MKIAWMWRRCISGEGWELSKGIYPHWKGLVLPDGYDGFSAFVLRKNGRGHSWYSDRNFRTSSEAKLAVQRMLEALK